MKSEMEKKSNENRKKNGFGIRFMQGSEKRNKGE